MANRVINTVLQLRDNMSVGLVRAARNAQRSGADISNGMINATRSVVAFKNKSVRAMKDFASGTAKAAAASASALTAAFLAMDGATEEYRIAQGRVNTAFESAGLSSEAAKKSYKEFYKILGETDTAAEASQLLAKLTKSEEDITKWTTISAGIMGTFGDSLPVEGLIEAANETARVGQVTGPLADALNWVSISEDAFNAKLAACSSEAERNKLIMNTLSGEYENAAKIYHENNAEQEKYRAYQLQIAQSTAVLGQASQTAKNKILEMLGAQEDGIRAGSVFDILSKKAQQFSDWINTVDLSAFAPKVEAFVSDAMDKASNAIKWIRENSDQLIRTLKILAGVFVGVKVGKFAFSIYDAAQNVIGFVKTVNRVFKIGGKLKTVFSSVKKIKGLFSGGKVAKTLLKFVSKAGPIGLIIAAVVTVGILIHKHWDKIKAVLESAWNHVKNGFGKVKDTVINAFQVIKDKVKTLIMHIPIVALAVMIYKNWDKIKETLSNAWNWVRSTFEAGKETVSNIFSGIKNKIFGVISGIWNNVKTVFSGIKNTMVTIFTSAKNTVVNVATGLLGKVKSIFTGMKDAITGAFTAAKEKVKDVIEWIDNKVSSIPILGNLYSGSKSFIGSAINLVTGHNALGTSYWKGGLTSINERGGEIVNLPSGAKVIPHDISVKIADSFAKGLFAGNLGIDYRRDSLVSAAKQSPVASNISNISNITNITNNKNLSQISRPMPEIANIIRELKNITRNDVKKVIVGKNALGTDYWKGGPTKVNERGGEIMDLPSGTRIIPHDVSKKAAGSPSINVNVTIQGNVIGNKAYANEVGEVIVEKILRAIENS